ncbi:bifunctional phosphopantothenoylcysteine decarboxylase/phosphopantothenate--cysteine ligase CoaBC [Candidatus Gottesmanbacteria bacterium]|nr:bifunctional phosphopantothenoylcysteine decarboxylase/phosphopantothenate--cysteine ligase CoaBC [Candidatus Gottesmanbacteria bacterium]
MRKPIVLGVTGGIAAFKILELVKLLKQQGVNIIVIETLSACRVVPPKEFEKASGNKVLTQLFQEDFDYKAILKARRVEHIDVAQSSSLIVIAPATANVMAKLAAGIADDYLTTAVLAATCPVMIYPSMNTVMWANPVTQKNVSMLRSLGMQVIAPASGILACGTEGEGRLPPVSSIADEIRVQLNRSHSLQGKRILVTAGATSEPIDAVRLLTNRSSGKMGVAIAEECLLRGGQVTLLRAKTAVQPRYPVSEYLFDTSDELEQLMEKHIPNVDVCFHIAAVSDFMVVGAKGKLSSQTSHALTLHPRKKIIDTVKKLNPNIFLIAFKAEAGLTDTQLIKAAKEKLKECQADMVVANHVDRPNQGFGVDANEVFIVTKQGDATHIPLASKRQVAQQILGHLSF